MRTRHFVVIFLVIASMAAGYVAHQRVEGIGRPTVVCPTLARPLSAYASGNGSSDVGGVRSDVDLRPLETFYSALKLVREEYVESIQQPQEKLMAYGSVRAMLDSLHDPLTRFLEPDRAKVVKDAADGKFAGIGAIIEVNQPKTDGIVEEKLVVVSTLPDSSARNAGLQNGDVITEVDSNSVLAYDPLQRVEKLVKDTRNGKMDRDKLTKIVDAESKRINSGVGFQKALDMLSKNDGKEYTLTVVRAGNAKNPLKIKVKNGVSVLEPVEYKVLPSGAGYVRINMANKAGEAAMATAISELKNKNAKGLVVDLRDSIGGSIDSMKVMSGYLVKNGTLSVMEISKSRKLTVKSVAPGESAAWAGGPVVVLVNKGTSGVSEALAAALKDDLGAKLIGYQTAGRSLQQTFVSFKDGSAFTMTTGKYLTPKGKDFRGTGLAADVKIAGSSASGTDAALTKAVAVLNAEKSRG